MRIRRGVSSRKLPCGCTAGIYETYSNEIVMLVDVKHASCADPTHAPGNLVPMTHPPGASHRSDRDRS